MESQKTNIISKNGLLKIMTKYGYYPYKGKRLDAMIIRCEFLSVQYPYVTITLVYDAPNAQKDKVHEIEFGGKHISTFQEFMESIRKINDINKQLKHQCQRQHSKAVLLSEPSTLRATSSLESTYHQSKTSVILSETPKVKKYTVKRTMSTLPKLKKSPPMSEP